jgi:hypothetical protein
MDTETAKRRIADALTELSALISYPDSGEGLLKDLFRDIAKMYHKTNPTQAQVEQFVKHMELVSFQITSLSLLFTGDICFTFDPNGAIRYYAGQYKTG